MDEDEEILSWDEDSSLRVRIVRVPTSGGTNSEAQARLNREALHELRFGLRNLEPEMVEAAQRMRAALSRVPLEDVRTAEDPDTTEEFLEQLLDDIELEFEIGRLVVERVDEPEPLGVQSLLPELPPLPPAKRVVREKSTETSFEVRFVDEIGQGIGGLEVEFDFDGRQERMKTNGAGVALLDGVTTFTCSVRVVDVGELEKILEPRWARQRFGKPPTGVNVFRRALSGGDFGGISLKAAVPNTVVIEPRQGKIFVELLDKMGRVHHANLPYRIEGPVPLTGKTDKQGRLSHENITPGQYTLKFTVEKEEHTTPVIVRNVDYPEPQIRKLAAVPRVVLARIKGIVFETNKSFLLPSAVRALQRISSVYADNEPAELLIVGHTDTTAEPTINDPLSLERADCTAAYLSDDVDAWLKMYELSTSEKRRWGSHEDQLMIGAMPDAGTRPPSEDPVRWYQRTRGLKVDGKAGPKTRARLVEEYMSFDGTSLKEPTEFKIRITTHGCGENFPLDESGQDLDSAAVDAKEDAIDRRVELFFFDTEFGIQPPPPGKNSQKGSQAYPEWRAKAKEIRELEIEDQRQFVLEWPDFLSDNAPSDLRLQVIGRKTIELPWSDGQSQGGMQRFVLRAFDEARCSIIAVTGEKKIQLWNDQPVDKPDAPPTWEHLLEELLARSETEPAVQDGSFPTIQKVHASPDLD